MAKSIQLPSAARLAVAPAAQPPPAPAGPVRHGPPLAPGLYRPAGMTDKEFGDLTAVGWQPGQAVTPDMRNKIAALEAEAATMGPPPIDPSTPPVDLDAAMRAATPKQKAVLGAAAASAVAEFRAPAQPAPSAVGQRVMSARQVNVDYGQPERPATRVVPDAGRGSPPNPPPAAPKRPKFLDASDEELEKKGIHIPGPAGFSGPSGVPGPPGPPTEPEPPEPPAPPPRTEDPIAPHANCPHCGWDLSAEDIPEPDYDQKMRFLTTQVLGDGKPYTRTYEMLGGRMHMTFRTLTVREKDACYRQATLDRQAGLVASDYEWIERVRRYQLYLSLASVRADTTLNTELPNGLDKHTSPHAESIWEQAEGDSRPLLQAVEDYVLGDVLTSATLCDIAMRHAARFEQEVRKLADQVDNPSFWQATGSQP